MNDKVALEKWVKNTEEEAKKKKREMPVVKMNEGLAYGAEGFLRKQIASLHLHVCERATFPTARSSHLSKHGTISWPWSC